MSPFRLMVSVSVIWLSAALVGCGSGSSHPDAAQTGSGGGAGGTNGGSGGRGSGGISGASGGSSGGTNGGSGGRGSGGISGGSGGSSGGCVVPTGCCATDADCPSTEECVNPTACAAGQTTAGVCKQKPATTTTCWRNEDCAFRSCFSAQVSPCGATPLVADKLGACGMP